MPKKSEVEYIKDILKHMEKTENFVKGCNYEEFTKNELLVCAVIRCLEVIGEAVKNLSKELTRKYPDIPWKEMAGMRDFLIHKYYDVDAEIVWNTVKNNIPQTKPLIERVLIDIEG